MTDPIPTDSDPSRPSPGRTADDASIHDDPGTVFTHGVASFDPSDDAVVLWTRAEGASRVSWHLAPAEGGPERSGELGVDPSHWCVTVDVDGLEPGADYRYWFTAGGHRSPTGRTLTLPRGRCDRFRLGVLCCADRSIEEFSVHRHLADEPVDLLVHLGDYIYENRGKGGRVMEPDRTCTTLADYDRRYAQARRDPATMAMHAAHPMVAVWDDHDVADNAWRTGAKAHDPTEHGEWEPRLRAAAAARQRWLPARLPDPADPLRLWRSVRIGDLAELVLMDTRIAGRDRQAGDEGARPLHDADRSLLGPGQRRWVEERIRDRSTQWCVLASQVVVSPMVLPVPVDATLAQDAPSGYAVVDGEAICTDEWDGYPAERSRLARWLADRGGDALILSGDVHSSWVFEGHLSPGIRPAAPEFVCPSVSSTPMARQLPPGTRPLAEEVARRGVDGPLWHDLGSWGDLVVELRPEAVTTTFHAVDATVVDGAATPLSSWRLEPGSPGRLRPVGGRRAAPRTRRGRRGRILVALAAALVTILAAVTLALVARRRVRRLRRIARRADSIRRRLPLRTISRRRRSGRSRPDRARCWTRGWRPIRAGRA